MPTARRLLTHALDAAIRADPPRTVRDASRNPESEMSTEHWIGVLTAAALCAYLVHALVRAQRY